VIQLTEVEHEVLLAKAERLRGIAQELERIQFEFIGAMVRAGVALLEQDPCGRGEISAAVNRLASERLLLAQLAMPSPQFYSPLVAVAAIELRDRVVKDAAAQKRGGAR
jgi:hypothetical protein